MRPGGTRRRVSGLRLRIRRGCGVRRRGHPTGRLLLLSGPLGRRLAPRPLPRQRLEHHVLPDPLLGEVSRRVVVPARTCGLATSLAGGPEILDSTHILPRPLLARPRCSTPGMSTGYEPWRVERSVPGPDLPSVIRMRRNWIIRTGSKDPCPHDGKTLTYRGRFGGGRAPGRRRRRPGRRVAHLRTAPAVRGVVLIRQCDQLMGPFRSPAATCSSPSPLRHRAG